MPPKKTTVKTNPLSKAAQERVALIRAQQEEDRRLAQEEENKRLEEERIERESEAEKQRLLEEKTKKKQDKIAAQKAAGTYKTEAEKRREKLKQNARSRGIVTSVAREKTLIQEESEDEQEESNLKSPIITIMGHVDTGKTTLLDKIRNTNIQGKEVAGITQQIGASFISKDVIDAEDINIPGLLFIDTPGHSAFGNLRIRGSQICDLAIVVIDLMKGIEKQTIEVLNICKENNVPFIIALNKIDRLYGWKDLPDAPILEKIENSREQYTELLRETWKYFYDNEITPLIFNEYTGADDTVMFIPVSGVTGEGVNDLLREVALYCQTYLRENLEKIPFFNATIMESKKLDTGENTIDLILKSGVLTVGDLLGISTVGGPSVVRVRGLQLPEENEEMRMNTIYRRIQRAEGSCGIKVIANGLEGAIPGTPVFILKTEDDEFEYFNSNIELDDNGVSVFAPSLGQLEAFVKYLRTECSPSVPVAIATVGNVCDKDILKVVKIRERYGPRYAHILCFDTEANREAREFAGIERIQIHYDRTIYRVYENFISSTRESELEFHSNLKREAKLPYELSILPGQIFRHKNPLVLGVKVNVGELHKNSRICDQTGKIVGTILGIRFRDKDVESAIQGSEVSISIESDMTFGRQITENSKFYPETTRVSLNFLKEHFRSFITKEVFDVITKIKKSQKIA